MWTVFLGLSCLSKFNCWPFYWALREGTQLSCCLVNFFEKTLSFPPVLKMCSFLKKVKWKWRKWVKYFKFPTGFLTINILSMLCTIHTQVCFYGPIVGNFSGLLCMWPLATFIGNKRKIRPKDIPSCLIEPCLLVLFTQRLEILVTVLHKSFQTVLKNSIPEKITNIVLLKEQH